jgi:hypothetical protein
MYPTSPTVVPSNVPNWCLALDRVHGHLEEILAVLEDLLEPPLDLAPIGQALLGSYQNLYDLLALNVEPFAALDALGRSLAELEKQLRAGGQEPHLTVAADSCRLARLPLEDARPTLQGLVWTQPTPPVPIKASLDESELHRLGRRVLLPQTKFAPPPPTEVFDATQPRPKPKNFSELREAADAMARDAKSKLAPKPEPPKPEALAPPPAEPKVEGFAGSTDPPLTPEEFRRARARDCFEEVAMIGMQRLPLFGDPWRASRVFERRMFENLDALVALGDVGLDHLQSLTLGSPIKDPSRLFALTLITGCVDGRDSLAVAERYFDREHLSDPAYAAAFVDALRIVPHPWVVPRCRMMLNSPSPIIQRVAVEVLAHKQLLSHEALGELSLSGPEVACAALPYFAMQDDPRLGDVLEQAMAWCDADKEDVVLFRGVAKAVAIADHPLARRFFFRHSRGPSAAYATLMLGLTATHGTAEELLDQVVREPTSDWVTALSWAGPKAAVWALIRLLEIESDDEVRASAGYGLERLTGAGFYEIAEVPPEKLEDPPLPEPDLGDPAPAALSARVSLPRDAPSEGSPDLLERPSTDPLRWRAHWQEHERRFEPTTRIRRGLGYTAFVSLDELDRGRYTPAERRALVTELVIRTGKFVPLAPEELVVAQERAIEGWKIALAKQARAPGSWDRAVRRIR